MRQLTAFASYHDNLGELLVGRVRFYNHPDGSPAEVFGLDNAHQTFISLGSVVFTDSSGRLNPQVFLANHDYLLVFDKYVGGGTMAEEDSVRGYLYNGRFYSDPAHTTEIQGDANKIYVDVPTDTTYRWTGAQYIVVGSDRDSWAEQGSAVDQYNTLGVKLEGSSVRSSGTISDLRQLPALSDDEIVLLLGYNTPGDKPAIYYKYNKNSTAQDNGGSVIAIEGQARGRWEIVECPRYLDVRHFGAFPNSGSVEDVEQRYAIQRAGNYAHENNCGLYFWGNSRRIYYDITGLELFDVDSDKNAAVFAIKSSDPRERDAIRATVRGVRNILCATDQNTTIRDHGRIELIDEVLRTSYSPAYYTKLSPTTKLVIDSEYASSYDDPNGVEVDVLVDTGNRTFTDCVINSVGHLKENTRFYGKTKLAESMFTDDCNFNSVTVDGHVIIPLEDFPTLSKWCALIRQQSDRDLDFQNRTLDETCYLGWPNDSVTYRNAKFDGYVIPHKAALYNCSGQIRYSSEELLSAFRSSLAVASIPSAAKLYLEDCQLGMIKNFYVDTLTVLGGQLGLLGTYEITVRNTVTIHRAGIATSINCDSLYVKHCTVELVSIQGRKAVDVEDCIFTGASVTAYSWRNSTAEDYNRLNARIVANKFLSSSKFKVAPNHTGVAVYKYRVDIRMCGNFSDHDFFDDSAFADEPNHSVDATDFSFVYDGNYGGCPVTEASWTTWINYALQKLDGNDAEAEEIPSHVGNVLYLYWDWRYRHSNDNHNIKRQFWWCLYLNTTIDTDTYNLFRVKNLKIRTSWEISYECIGEIYTQSYGSCMNVIPGQLFVRGLNAGSHTTDIEETLTHQMETDTVYTDGDLDEKKSRLARIVSSRMNTSISDGARIQWKVKHYRFLRY